MKKFFCFVLTLMTVFMCGCDYAVKDYWKDLDQEDDDTKTVFEEQSELFKIDEEVRSKYVFETNEKKFLTQDGYTLWSYDDSVSGYNDFCVSLSKISGESGAGYGTVFCVCEIDGKTFMMCVLINSKGKFCVGRVDDGQFSYVVPWKQGSGILLGAGVSNEISVAFDENEKKFKLEINGEENVKFSLPVKIDLNDCRFGYVVVISNRENFPKVPVKVLFEHK